LNEHRSSTSAFNFCHSVKPGLRSSGSNHHRSFPGKRECGGSADAGASARHYGNFVCETLHMIHVTCIIALSQDQILAASRASSKHSAYREYRLRFLCENACVKEVSRSRRRQTSNEALGMNGRIHRRDFLNSMLIASGATLLGDLTPSQLMAKEAWTGYSGTGDYARCNGNTYEVVHAGHQIRDNVFRRGNHEPVETNEIFDCIVTGGGISGMAAALRFHHSNFKLTCLVLENHPVFGGEAKRNEFIVHGERLAAPQGSGHFRTPVSGSFLAEYYERIGVDPSKFEYQAWASRSPEIPVGHSFEFVQDPYGFFFGAKFGQRPEI